ncbi:phage major capsid protein [Hominenteromicrobium sp.]|jgi:HK97 family phage major capsid protein|uniref:phage major capsid protein n=1 Tax=Hominenteromicrobium sp. TaxID=3073581 RepID=UPI003AEF868B
MATNIVNRTDLSGLIPEPVTREIIQGVTEGSAVLQMGRRLPNMTSKTQTMNVLDMLPTAYFVNGDTGMKQTTKMKWDKKKIYAEEIAVIVPIPEAVLDDADYDIWGEVRPRLVEAFGKVIDGAILFGTNKPTSWRDSVLETCTKAGSVVAATPYIYDDLLAEGGVIAKVEESGYLVNGIMSAIQMRAKLRGLKDLNGNPIFKTDMQGATPYALDGSPMYFPRNGAFDTAKALMFAGDWSELVYSIRQDITFKIFDQGVVQDPSDNSIVYNLMQNDMVALRAVMRLGWEIPNPKTAYNDTLSKYCPFAVYAPAGTVNTVTVTPATATVAKGASKAFAAAVTGEGAVSNGVLWSVSGTAAVKAGTKIDENGTLTIASNETNTALTVTATSKQDGTKSGTAAVTVG